ncbi:glycoside hydrolase family 73 protein [Blattabacterium cuenoti]|uniref:glycoside hydrolase family 73 protein n=1 Tax=Blattabacterium cuenoti TaxID=1653831 RepID=UPI00163D35C0|nr:glucosaminidase domain-containing protein [Blattabacterium cuenoti]
MKKLFYFFLFILSFTFSSFSKDKKEKEDLKHAIEYIKKYAQFAIEEMEKFGIPASIKLGQGILESYSGRSFLSKNTNNHFGIKCGKNWVGGIYFHDDDLPKECFRKYKSVRESFRDHSKFLKQPRYHKLFFLDKNDYQSWAMELKKAGYATSIKYAESLIKQIEKYCLWKFDKENSYEINNKIDKYLTFIMEKNMEKNKVEQSNFIVNFFIKIAVFLKNKIQFSE